MFIGYNPLHKGYCCFHPPSQRVYISRHVVFDETFLPYNDLFALSKHVHLQGEIIEYLNIDECILSASQLQPASLSDNAARASPSDNVAPSSSTPRLFIFDDSNNDDANIVPPNDHQPVATTIL